jgi:LacI family transcriptional regulator
MTSANRPTIKEVALASGVSTATVSRVLSGGSQVSPDLTARVMHVVHELGYSPNGLTRGVFLGRSNSIGVLIGDLRSHFYVELVRGVEETATEAGSSVVLAQTSRDPDAERRLLSLMDEQRVRGLITTTGPDNDDLIDRMASRGTQCVLLTRVPGQARPRLHSVHLDDRAAGALAARHLHALGRRRIAVLTTRLALTTQRLRLEGVNSQWEASHRRAGAGSTLATEPDVDNVAEAIHKICLARPRGERPDALICTSGRLTLGAVGALRSSGVRVPDDLALVSFDDFPWAPLLDPALTVVDQNPQQMGIHATELILAEPAQDEPVEIVEPPTLIVRRSCGTQSGQPAHLPDPPHQHA